jgi:hypothetical protein
MKKPSMPKSGRKKASSKKLSSRASAKDRRRRSATTAVNKGSTLLQTDQGTQLVWGGNQPRPQKV